MPIPPALDSLPVVQLERDHCRSCGMLVPEENRRVREKSANYKRTREHCACGATQIIVETKAADGTDIAHLHYQAPGAKSRVHELADIQEV